MDKIANKYLILITKCHFLFLFSFNSINKQSITSLPDEKITKANELTIKFITKSTSSNPKTTKPYAASTL